MKTGLFISREDGVVSDHIDLGVIAQTYSHLASVKVYDNFFSSTAVNDIREIINQKDLNSIVLAGPGQLRYTGVYGGKSFIDAVSGQSINPNKIAIVNLNENVAVVHRNRLDEATSKASLYVDVALAKLADAHDLNNISISPRKSVLILGATPSGLLAAKMLLDKGYRVCIADKSEQIDINDTDRFKMELTPVMMGLESHDCCEIKSGVQLTDFYGMAGNYTAVFSTDGKDTSISIGGVIVCVEEDKGWINRLRPLLQIARDNEGFMRSNQPTNMVGKTKKDGVWFVPVRSSELNFGSIFSETAKIVLLLTTLLDQEEIKTQLYGIDVDETICGGCGTCVKTCAFSAASLDFLKKLSFVDANRCVGCGNCVTSCPTNARNLKTYPEEYVLKAIDVLSKGVQGVADSKILILHCNGNGAAAIKNAAYDQHPDLLYSPNVFPLQVECGASMDTQYILRAFQKGFDGVGLMVCQDGHCNNLVGNLDMERRMSLFREVLRSRKIDSDRLRIIKVPHDCNESLLREIKSFSDDLSQPKEVM